MGGPALPGARRPGHRALGHPSRVADFTAVDRAGKANKAWGGCCMMRAADLHPALPEGVMQHWKNSGYSDDWIITQAHTLRRLHTLRAAATQVY
jgi:hypothetical protein